MNVTEHHDITKPVSTFPLMKTETGITISLRIEKNGQLSKHLTPIPAILICITGKAEFNNVKDEKQTLLPGDYVTIEPNVMHWVDGLEDSQLILVK